MNNWKNQVKSRARKNRAEQLATGGGSSRVQKLTDLEERALDVWGRAAVFGDQNVQVLGFDEIEIIDETKHIAMADDVYDGDGVELTAVTPISSIPTKKRRIDGVEVTAETPISSITTNTRRIRKRKPKQSKFKFDTT